MAKLTLNTIGSRYGSIDALNDNFDSIENALENTLSRDGTTPNTMTANLDMNSQRIINLPDGTANTDAVNLRQVTSLLQGAAEGLVVTVKERATATSGQTVFNLGAVVYVVGANNLSVFVDGIKQYPGESYTETDADTVTFSSGLTVGSEVLFIVNESITSTVVTASATNYTPGGTDAVPTTVQAKLRESVSVLDFGADPTGTTECATQIKAAIDYGIANGKAVYVPSGTYLCTYNTLIFDFATSTSKTFSIFGDGATSILKMGDGLVDATNRRFFDMRPAIDMDVIELRDLVFDNNARGSAVPPSPFDYEQSHTIRFAGESGTTTKLLRYHNVIVKDPVADGMNNQGYGLQEWVVSNCAEIDRTRVRSSIQCSGLPVKNLNITGFVGYSIEAEVIPSLAPASETTVSISNSHVEGFDISGGADAGKEYVRVQISNSKATDSAGFANCVLQINNCDLRLSSTGQWAQLGSGCRVSDSKIRARYDASTGVVTPLYLYVSGSFNHEITLDNCDLLIDYPEGTLPVAASGYLVTDGLAFPNADAALYKRDRSLINCRFDARSQKSVNAYRNGRWYLKDCTYASASGSFAVNWGTTSGFLSVLSMDGGDCQKMLGDLVSSSWSTSANGQSLRFTGLWIGDNASEFVTISAGLNGAFGVLSNRQITRDSLPTDGVRGDVVVLSSINVGLAQEYQCTTGSAGAAAVYRMTAQAGVGRGTTAARPAPLSQDVGLMYLDTTLDADGKPIWWTGTAWVDATGAIV